MCQLVRESSLGHPGKGTGTRAAYSKATFSSMIKKEPQADGGSWFIPCPGVEFRGTRSIILPSSHLPVEWASETKFKIVPCCIHLGVTKLSSPGGLSHSLSHVQWHFWKLFSKFQAKLETRTCESKFFYWKLIMGIPRMMKILYSPWQTLGIPSALTPIG